MKKILFILALFSLLFGGFSIAAQGLGFSQTVVGMNNVLNAAPGTAVWMNEKLSVLMWTSNGAATSSYNFVVVSNSGEVIKDLASIPGFGGIRLNTMSAVDFIKWMETSGFKQVSPAALPACIPQAIASAKSVIFAPRSLFSPVIILPATILAPFMPTPDGGYKS